MLVGVGGGGGGGWGVGGSESSSLYMACCAISCSVESCSACHCEHACCTCCAARSRVDPQAFQLVSQQLRAASACLFQNFAPPSRRKEGCGLFLCAWGFVCVVPSTECHCSFTCKARSFRICQTLSASWLENKVRCDREFQSVHGKLR